MNTFIQISFFWLPGILIAIKLLNNKKFYHELLESMGKTNYKRYILSDEDAKRIVENTDTLLSKIFKSNSKVKDKFFSGRRDDENLDDLSHYYVGSKMKYFTKGFLYFWVVFIGVFVLSYYLQIIISNFLFSYSPVIDGASSGSIVELAETGLGLAYLLGPCNSIFFMLAFYPYTLTKIAPNLYLIGLISKNDFIGYLEDIAMTPRFLRKIFLVIGLFSWGLYFMYTYQQTFYFENKIVVKTLLGTETYELSEISSFDKYQHKDKKKLHQFLKLSFKDKPNLEILDNESKYVNIEKSDFDYFALHDHYIDKISKYIPLIKSKKSYSVISDKYEYTSGKNSAKDYVTLTFLAIMFNFASLCFGLFWIARIYYAFEKTD